MQIFLLVKIKRARMDDEYLYYNANIKYLNILYSFLIAGPRIL
jgi:hypothetical protein